MNASSLPLEPWFRKSARYPTPEANRTTPKRAVDRRAETLKVAKSTRATAPTRTRENVALDNKMKYRQYHWLQEYVHRGYRWQRSVLEREWSTHAQQSAVPGGPRCLELACGGGNLADIFPPERYVGLDLTPERVAAAAQAHPLHRFMTGDVTQPSFDAILQGTDFVFCHGLLHHLDDAGCRVLLARIDHNITRPGTVVMLEPLLPDPWKNPPGYVLCRADDGKFIRKSEAYVALLDGHLVRSERHSFLPRWPVSMDAYVARYD